VQSIDDDIVVNGGRFISVSKGLPNAIIGWLASAPTSTIGGSFYGDVAFSNNFTQSGTSLLLGWYRTSTPAWQAIYVKTGLPSVVVATATHTTALDEFWYVH
jgi:hypothetical protein